MNDMYVLYHNELTAYQIEHNNGDIYIVSFVPIYIHRQTISMYKIESPIFGVFPSANPGR